MDPDTKYFFSSYVGERNIISAGYFGRDMIRKIENGHIPTFTSDGYPAYTEMLLNEYGYRFTKPRRSNIGRNPVAHVVPMTGLNYGQVVKTREGLKLVDVERKDIFGSVDGKHMNTSIVERMNLSIRTCLARFKRKTLSFSKDIEMMRDSIDLFRTVFNFCSGHGSLNKRSCRDGVKQTVTPAMMTGITDDVWTLRRLMEFPHRNYVNQL